jgi:hypothetical protein
VPGARKCETPFERAEHYLACFIHARPPRSVPAAKCFCRSLLQGTICRWELLTEQTARSGWQAVRWASVRRCKDDAMQSHLRHPFLRATSGSQRVHSLLTFAFASHNRPMPATQHISLRPQSSRPPARFRLVLVPSHYCAASSDVPSRVGESASRRVRKTCNVTPAMSLDVVERLGCSRPARWPEKTRATCPCVTK